MAEANEQGVCIKFCVRLGKTGSENLSTANDDPSGRPSTATTPSKVEQVRAAVDKDRRRTIHDLCT